MLMEGEVSVILHVHRDSLRDASYTRLRAWRRTEWNVGIQDSTETYVKSITCIRCNDRCDARTGQSSQGSFVRTIRNNRRKSMFQQIIIMHRYYEMLFRLSIFIEIIIW